MHQIDAAAGIELGEIGQQALHVGIVGQALGQFLLVERLGAGEDQRLQQPQMLRVVGRDDVGHVFRGVL